MNLGELKTALKRFGFDDSDPLALWINAAMHDLESETDWPWLEGLDEIAISAGESDITVPSDFFKVIYLRDATNKKPWDYYDMRRFEREIVDPTTTGKPYIFTVMGFETINFYPVADSALTARLLYLKDLGDMTDDAHTPGTGIVPLKLHYAIVLKAASMALAAENEEERAQYALNEYGATIAAVMRSYDLKQLGEPEAVEDTQGYGYS